MKKPAFIANGLENNNPATIHAELEAYNLAVGSRWMRSDQKGIRIGFRLNRCCCYFRLIHFCFYHNKHRKNSGEKRVNNEIMRVDLWKNVDITEGKIRLEEHKANIHRQVEKYTAHK